MPLTPEQRNAALAKGRATARANREARKLLQQSVPSESVTPDVSGETPELQVEVNIPVQPVHKLSLKDRLFGNKAAQPAKKTPVARGRAKKPDNNLISTVLPTIIASFVATYARDKMPDPYKVCAPSQMEVNAMLSPIMAIIARRVEITGKASQDAIDIANALICSLAYGSRAYITYIQIKRMEDATNGSNSNRTSQPGPGSYQAESNAVSGASTGGNVPGWQSVSGNVNVPNDTDDASGDGNPEAAIFASMFERDKRGRVRLGLLSA